MENEAASLLVVSSLHGVKAGVILAVDAPAFELVGVEGYQQTAGRAEVAQAVEDSLVLSAIYGYLILAITVAGCAILWRHRKRIHLREGTSPIPAQEKRGLFLGNSGMIAMMVLSGILMLYVAFLA